MTDEQRDYLDELRDSGVTNMWAAPTYLMQRYGISKEEAFEVFSEWKEYKINGEG